MLHGSRYRVDVIFGPAVLVYLGLLMAGLCFVPVKHMPFMKFIWATSRVSQ